MSMVEGKAQGSVDRARMGSYFSAVGTKMKE